ncbi:DUF2304 family protein [Patescibacteria group bacterium]|nr:DUF2304 family protein [Patescibacteria group bacterium]MBU1673232.1 DUF2304 family protein [Patescibacteria group bacterium]MBU1964010.1 DUF2304 family protein [Patescibacteria group bacterium]
MIIKFLIILFILFALSRLILRFKDGSVGIWGFLLWGALWIIIGIVTFLPQTTTVVASILGVGRGADVAVYISIILLFYAVFRLGIKQENIESQITELVRKDALNSKKK